MSQPSSSTTRLSSDPLPSSALTAPGVRKNGLFLLSFPPSSTHGYPLTQHFFPNINLTLTSGKQWHIAKTAFRPGTKSTGNSYAQRTLERQAISATKAKEKEMKEEKEAERQVCLAALSSLSTSYSDMGLGRNGSYPKLIFPPYLSFSLFLFSYLHMLETEKKTLDYLSILEKNPID